MGSYLYVTKPSALAAVLMEDGSTRIVNVYHYAYKPYGGFSEWDERNNRQMHNRHITPCITAFRRKNVRPLEYGVLGTKSGQIEPGAPVFMTHHNPVVVDDLIGGGNHKVVGVVKEARHA
jgi:hypothetical protein